MAKAIEQTLSGLTIGHAALGTHGAETGSVRQQVHDGDTVIVRPSGNLGVRFLGIDTPEVSFQLPGDRAFRSIADKRWVEFLTNPFASAYPAFKPALEPSLRKYLRSKCGPAAALNHHRHAKHAEQVLEREVEGDVTALGTTREDFRFFLAFAFEVMDRYGRLLGYLNREQPQDKASQPRPPSYNERLLALGVASPYFIWPNVNPFRRAGSLTEAVPLPKKITQVAERDAVLDAAREAVRSARAKGIGIFNFNDPLQLDSFELRFLARRKPPDRWVIDLTGDKKKILPPQSYFAIPNPEDRLFIPAEYVPLFVEKGWKRG